MSTPPKKSSVWLSLLGELGFVFAILTAWLYLSGWRYVSLYFDYFGIGVNSLALQEKRVFAHGFWIVNSNPVILLCCILSVVLIIFLTRRYRHLVFAEFVIGVFAVSVVAFFQLGYFLAERTAVATYSKIVSEDYPSFPNAQVWLKKTSALDPTVGEELADLDACYRVVIIDEHSIILIKPVKDYAPLRGPTLVLPRTSVEAIRVHQRWNSCSL